MPSLFLPEINDFVKVVAGRTKNTNRLIQSNVTFTVVIILRYPPKTTRVTRKGGDAKGRALGDDILE